MEDDTTFMGELPEICGGVILAFGVVVAIGFLIDYQGKAAQPRQYKNPPPVEKPIQSSQPLELANPYLEYGYDN